MTGRPYVVLSCAMSLDGCLDGTGEDRLVLSGEADLDRVDAERAAADAILVGAGTIRRDDPRLLVRSARRQAGRRARGRPPQPAGVTITASGDLDPAARFFRGGGEAGAGDVAPGTGGAGRGRGGPRAPAARVEGGDPARRGRRSASCTPPARCCRSCRTRSAAWPRWSTPATRRGSPQILADLGRRGVRRLLVEGGARLGTQLLAGGMVDELQLAIAPFFVGDAAAPRFAGPGQYPAGPAHPLHLAEARPVGEVVLLRYLAAGPAGPGGPPGSRPEAAARG